MALYDKITFQKKLNDSVQVGDDLYFSNISIIFPNDSKFLILIVFEVFIILLFNLSLYLFIYILI